MVKQIVIDGEKHPFVMSMATVEHYIYNRSLPLADLTDFFQNLTTKDIPELILEGFRVGALLNDSICELSVADLMKANVKGEISLMKMAEDLNTIADEDAGQGK